jgi:hypothetical protein
MLLTIIITLTHSFKRFIKLGEIEKTSSNAPSFFLIMLKVLEERAVTMREGSNTIVITKSLGTPLIFSSLCYPIITLVSLPYDGQFISLSVSKAVEKSGSIRS